MKGTSHKILVTGADGFIGSHLVELLHRKGFEVRAYCYYNSFNSWGWLDSLPQSTLREIEVVTGDVRDGDHIREAAQGCQGIFHLAALIAIPYSYHAPQSYVDTNVKGTLNVVQAAKELGVQRVLVTSTSEVYGTAQFVPITEAHPKQPQSPYSASKIGADAVALSYHNSFDLPLTVVRPFNTYGPRQSARAIIPTIITQILAGAKSLELGDLRPTRDLLYVSDTAQGFLDIYHCPDLIGKEVNMATGTEISIHDLVQKIAQLMGANIQITTDKQRLRPANSEVFRLLGDASFLREHTGWKPQWNLEKGLKATIDWFSLADNLKLYKAHDYNV